MENIKTKSAQEVWLSGTEISGKLKITKRTLRNYVNQGKIPGEFIKEIHTQYGMEKRYNYNEIVKLDTGIKGLKNNQHSEDISSEAFSPHNSAENALSIVNKTNAVFERIYTSSIRSEKDLSSAEKKLVSKNWAILSLTIALIITTLLFQTRKFKNEGDNTSYLNKIAKIEAQTNKKLQEKEKFYTNQLNETKRHYEYLAASQASQLQQKDKIIELLEQDMKAQREELKALKETVQKQKEKIDSYPF